MEFTKKDLLIYKKLKQKLSRDKIKKLIKNQEEFNLPDDIISVLRKFRMQDTVGGGSSGFTTFEETREGGKTKRYDFSISKNKKKEKEKKTSTKKSAKNLTSTKGSANNSSNVPEGYNKNYPDNLNKAQEYIRKVCEVGDNDGTFEEYHPFYDYKINYNGVDYVALRHQSHMSKAFASFKFCLVNKGTADDKFYDEHCKDKKEKKTREQIAKDLDFLQLSKKNEEKLKKEGEYDTYFGKCQNLEEENNLNKEELKKARADRKKNKAARKKSKTYPNYPETLYQNSINDIHRYPINYSLEEYPDYESLQESPAFQQGYQDQMNKYLQESPEYNQGYQDGIEYLQENPDVDDLQESPEYNQDGIEYLQENPDVDDLQESPEYNQGYKDGIEYLQENPNFEEQPLHEIEYYNQQVPLEENPNYVEYPQQQYPNTMETPYGDRYIINYN